MSNFNFIFIFIFSSLIYHLIATNSECHSHSFHCPNLGLLQFPISDANRPTCRGPLTVDCAVPSSPRIQLQPNGPWYDIIRRLSETSFRIRDPILQARLNASSCNSFTWSINLQSSPSTSLRITSRVTIAFRCSDPPLNQDPTLINEYFFGQNYTRFAGCPGFVVFYRSPGNGSDGGEITVPEACQEVVLPIGGSENVGAAQFFGVFGRLSGEFDVEWEVSRACLECREGGGVCESRDGNTFLCREEGNRTVKKLALLTGGIVVGGLSITLLISFILHTKGYRLTSKWPILRKIIKRDDIDAFLNDHKNFEIKQYRYSDLKKITSSFKEKLGQGGYGSVYKGELPDGRLVAVKMLINESKESDNGGEFINELASITRTSHINVVSLLGFCFEGSKRALVYEFMPNGSLEKYIYNARDSNFLGWEKLSKIVLGVARGLEYLHQGCNTRIVHLDMKPHNILLDKGFNPKISDFGLAKLCPNRSSTMSMLGTRGTMGYIAPEVFCRNFGKVSYKSDVYSYGMMVLELAGCTGNVQRGDVECTSDMHFPNYVYKQLKMEVESEIRISGSVADRERKLVRRKLIIVGMWCVQIDPEDRPTMSKVVEMLEGSVESLGIPPKPYLSSPPRSGLGLSQARSASSLSTSRSL